MYAVTYMLRKLALESAEVVAIVGERIYTGLARQEDSYPYIVMDVISNTESPTQDEASAVDDYRVQVDFYAKNSTESGLKTVTDMSEAFKIAVNRKFNNTYPGYILQSVQSVGHTSDYDPVQQVSRIINDFIVKIKRT